jgi:hypothetical protein
MFTDHACACVAKAHTDCNSSKSKQRTFMACLRGPVNPGASTSRSLQRYERVIRTNYYPEDRSSKAVSLGSFNGGAEKMLFFRKRGGCSTELVEVSAVLSMQGAYGCSWIQDAKEICKKDPNMSFVTFLACPKKGDPKKAPGENPLRQARSSSVHFGNSPFGLRHPKCLTLGLGRLPGFSHGTAGFILGCGKTYHCMEKAQIVGPRQTCIICRGFWRDGLRLVSRSVARSGSASGR